MENKKLSEFVSDGDKERFDSSSLKDCMCVEPNYGDYSDWLSAFSAATPDRNNPKKEIDRDAVKAAPWLAVNAVVRQANGTTRQFVTEQDFRNSKGRLGEIVGLAATMFLVDYATEGREKKAV